MTIMNNSPRKLPALLQSTLLNLAFFSASLLLADQKYEISDDFIIDNVLSGALGTAYASRAPYINRLLGEFLAFVNRHTSGFSVFFIFQLIVSLLAFTAVTYILLTRSRAAIGLSLAAVMLLFLTDDYYILVCCTRTAALSAAAGGALFLHALFPPENEPRSLPELLSGAFLALTGSLIRIKSALLVLPFLFLLFLCFSLSEKTNGTVLRMSGSPKENQTPKNRPRSLTENISPKNRPHTLPSLFSSLALLALALLLFLLGERLNASDPAYASYKTFDDRRSAVVDTAPFGYDSIRGTMEELGLSEIDYYMLRTWNFNDRGIFTDEVLDTIAEAQDKVRFDYTTNPETLLSNMKSRHYHSYACLPGIVLIFAYYLYSRRHIPYAVSVLLLAAALLLIFELLGRAVYRVSSGILTAEAVALLSSPCFIKPSKKREPFRERAAIVLLLVLLLASKQVLRQRNDLWTYGTDEEYRYWTEMNFTDSDNFVAGKYTFTVSKRGPQENLIAAIDADSEHYYLLDFTSTIQRIFYNYPHTQRLPVDYYTDNYSYLGGVLTNFPPVNEDLLRHGLDPDALIRSVVEDNVLVVDNNLTEIRLLYLREHYYPNARAELVGEIDGFKIWQYFAE